MVLGLQFLHDFLLFVVFLGVFLAEDQKIRRSSGKLFLFSGNMGNSNSMNTNNPQDSKLLPFFSPTLETTAGRNKDIYELLFSLL